LDYKKCPYQSVIDHSHESNSGATKNSIATTAIVS